MERATLAERPSAMAFPPSRRASHQWAIPALLLCVLCTPLANAATCAFVNGHPATAGAYVVVGSDRASSGVVPFGQAAHFECREGAHNVTVLALPQLCRDPRGGQVYDGADRLLVGPTRVNSFSCHATNLMALAPGLGAEAYALEWYGGGSPVERTRQRLFLSNFGYDGRITASVRVSGTDGWTAVATVESGQSISQDSALPLGEVQFEIGAFDPSGKLLASSGPIASSPEADSEVGQLVMLMGGASSRGVQLGYFRGCDEQGSNCNVCTSSESDDAEIKTYEVVFGSTFGTIAPSGCKHVGPPEPGAFDNNTKALFESFTALQNYSYPPVSPTQFEPHKITTTYEAARRIAPKLLNTTGTIVNAAADATMVLAGVMTHTKLFNSSGDRTDWPTEAESLIQSTNSSAADLNNTASAAQVGFMAEALALLQASAGILDTMGLLSQDLSKCVAHRNSTSVNCSSLCGVPAKCLAQAKQVNETLRVHKPTLIHITNVSNLVQSFSLSMAETLYVGASGCRTVVGALKTATKWVNSSLWRPFLNVTWVDANQYVQILGPFWSSACRVLWPSVSEHYQNMEI